MKTSHIFWGILFIGLGLLVLINNFTTIFMDWSTIWKLWPLVIVLLGLSILIKHQYGKGVMAGLAAIVLALAIFASFKTATHFIHNDFEVVFGDESNYEFVTTEYSEKYDSTLNYAVLNFGAGAGSFSISDTTSELFYANTKGRKNYFELRRYDTDSSSFIDFDMEGASFVIGDKGYKNKVDMLLNSNPMWDLNFGVGAASMDFDLTGFKVKTIDVDMGAASLNIKLGSLSKETSLYIEAGASDIDIFVPAESGCKILTDGALSSKHFKEFEKIDSDHYETENFNEAVNKIFIEIDSGVSSISVARY
jgi:hypothetical protein